MIDWEAKVRDLRRMADELEMVSMKEMGRHKMIQGRICDDLRRLAAEIEAALQGDQAAEEDWEADESA
jgi:hypothetical protein